MQQVCARYTLLAVVGLLLSSGVASDMPVQAGSIDRPNILLISIDDLRPDLGSYGHPVAKTPSLDAFAESSVCLRRPIASRQSAVRPVRLY